MDNTNFNRLKIFFFGTPLSGLEYVRIYNSKIKHKSIKFTENERGCKVLGIELESGKVSSKYLVEIINKYKSDEVSECYFIMKRKQYIRPVIEAVKSLSFGRSELYGIDPDYYSSFVPLMEKNHRAVERYVAALKCSSNAKGMIKGVMKNVLISLDLSRKLYEGFVVVISMEQDGTAGTSENIC